jgi:asparagine synthase (glutamine-hydrolysing)
LRYPTAPEAEESAWQKLVLEYLGAPNQVVIDITHELDFVGPVATTQLLEYGVLFPPNSHTIAPLLASSTGGTLLLGVGGDELLGSGYWTRMNDVLARRRRPELRDPARLALIMLPGSLRRAWFARRYGHNRPWLRTSAARNVRALERRWFDEPLRTDRAIDMAARSRILAVCMASLRHLGRALDVRVEAPLIDRRFVAALARAAGARGWGNRHATMRAIAEGDLPDALIERRDKAEFTGTHFGQHTRQFAEHWSGGGLDPDLVDVDALRQMWLSPQPNVRTALLLQLAWLHDHASGATSRERALLEEPAAAAS